MTDNIEVIIIDASEIRREGLRLLLLQGGFTSVWCSGEPPVPAIQSTMLTTRPLVIMCGTLDDDLDQIGAIKQIFPDSRMVLMGGETLTLSQFREALNSGVDTIVPKSISMESLIFTLRLVHGGAIVFPNHMVQSVGRLPLLDDLRIAKPEVSSAEADSPYRYDIASAPLLEGYRLSERETSVLMWLRDGLPNKEIARKMSITEATVKVHVKAILRKVKMRNRTQVASWFTKHDLCSQAAFTAE